MKARYSLIYVILICCPLAHAASPRADTRIIRVTAGVGDFIRQGCYTDVRVLVRHEGTESLKARLVAAGRRKNDGRFIVAVERAVELPPHSRKQVELPFYVEEDTDTVDVGLWVGGQRVAHTVAEPSVLPRDVETLLVVGEDSLGFEFEKRGFSLSLGGSPNYNSTPDTVRVGFLSDWTSLPTHATGYEGLDTILLTGAPPQAFDAERQRALRRWVSDGGTLMVCAGSAPAVWQSSPLTTLLPVTLTGKTVLHDLRPLARLVDNPPIPDGNMMVAASRLRQGARVIAGDASLPWVVVGAGRYYGTVVWLAFDPLREPFRSWESRLDVWRSLLRWLRGSGRGPNFTGLGHHTLHALIREANVVSVPSRFLFLAPVVVYAVLTLVVTVYVARFARRKEMTWLALTVMGALFSVGYFVALRRAVKGQLYLVGVTTRTLMPNDPTEYQSATAALFLPIRHPLEVTSGAPDVRFDDSTYFRDSPWSSRIHRIEEDAAHFRADYPHTWSVDGFYAYRETPRRGDGIVTRLRREGTAFHYHLTNRTPDTLRHGRVIMLHPDKFIVRSLPTLPPGASAQVTLSATAGERWSHEVISLGKLPRAKPKAEQHVRRWLAANALSDTIFDVSGMGYPSRRRPFEGSREWYGAALIAFMDAPPFSLHARGFRQQWHHLVVAPLPGVHPNQQTRGEYSDQSSTDLDSAQLLSNSARLEDDNEESTTNVYRGEARMELSFNPSQSKDKRIFAVSLDAKPLRKAEMECAFYNWRTGQWTRWKPKFDKRDNAYVHLSLDHVHPALFVSHLRLTVRGDHPKAFVKVKSMNFYVKPKEED